MVSKRFKTIIILFNLIMALLILILYQLTLIQFEGFAKIIMEGFWLVGVGSSSPDEPQLVHTYPTPNLPLILFILTMIVDFYFLIRIKTSRE